MAAISLEQLRRYAVARSLFRPTTLGRAIGKLGFLQADPIRAPSRAQDLTLRHRVTAYRAGDLERRYPGLPLEEDFFINYGYLPRQVQQLMHPRAARTAWSNARWAQAAAVREFIAECGVVHPREVNAKFDHGKAQNWFGGSSNASTQLLDAMHYRGLLRVAGRESGVRLYAIAVENQHRASSPGDALDALIDLAVKTYAPLPAATLSRLVNMVCGTAAPQWRDHRRAGLEKAKRRVPHAEVDGLVWYWPEGENPASKYHALDDDLRLLAPFDPIVWDRVRFEHFWAWPYRFEAYTPAPKRIFGYYAMPMLWRGEVLGWANAKLSEGELTVHPGFVSGSAPSEVAFKREFREETERLREFLGA